jgi:hypothetical protein
MRRLAPLLAAALLAVPAGAGAAEPRPQPISIDPELELADERLAGIGAVGLLVPDAGPRTSEERARAALIRGEVRNSLRDGLPEGPPLIVLRPLEPGGVVLALPQGGDQPNDRRYPIAVVAPGRSALLTSDSTRISGLVSIADIAQGKLRTEPTDDPVAALRELDERITENGEARAPAAALAAALILLLAFVSPRAAVLGFATALAANLVLGIAGVSGFWAVVLGIGLAVAVAAPLAARVLRSPLAIGLSFAGVIAAYLVAMGIDAEWVALSPLGPTQNARFYGLSNLLETMLLVPALAGAALLRKPLGWAAFAAVAVLALVTVAGSRFGADGGGAIVLAAGYSALVFVLVGAGRRALGLALAGAAGAVLLIAVDALVGPSTHVGRTVRGGPDELLSALGDRVTLSWGRATDEWSVGLAALISLAVLAFLVVRTLGRELEPDARALLVGLAAAIAVSLVVNDSPKEVAVGGVVAYVALARYVGAGAPHPAGRIAPVLSRS